MFTTLAGRGRAILVAAVFLLLAPCSAHTLEFAYTTEIAGIKDSELSSAAEELSKLRTLQDRPPATVDGLRRRAEDDVDLLSKLLRSRGYYAGRVEYAIDAKATPARVRLDVEPGPVYRLREFSIGFRAAPPEAREIAIEPKELGIELGMPATSAAIVAAEQRLLVELGRRGFPFARASERKVVVDHGTHSLAVTLEVEPGAFARFGPVRVDGLNRIERPFVERRIAWTPGAPYDLERVEATRRKLLQTGLFSSVEIAPAGPLGEAGALPMSIAAEEAKQRAIGAGAGYSTDEGPGGRVFWEHHNLAGQGERLNVVFMGTLLRRSLTSDFRKPDFLHPQQSLLAELTLSGETTDAFDRRAIEGSLGLERQLLDTLSLTGGVALERALVEEDSDEQGFTLVSLPLSLRRDTADDLLNPTRGDRTVLSLRPFLQPLGSDLTFLSARLKETVYLSLTESDAFVLAGWGSLGWIVGEARSRIPADKRFFSGGGGSIRGYGFQLAGPLDENDDPIGGRSLLEFGAELRARVTESIGGVAFVEAGNVYADSTPEFGEKLFVGAGFGLRYFTSFGPLRLDVGFPLDRRNDVDDPVQVYISLGQAF